MARSVKPDLGRMVSVRPSSIQLMPGNSLRHDLTGQDLQVAEIEQLRAELHDYKVRHKSLLECVPVAVVTVAPTGFILHANRRAEAMLGGGGRLVNQRMGRFVHPTSAAAFETALDTVMTSGDKTSLELMMMTRSSASTTCSVEMYRSHVNATTRVTLCLVDMTRTAEAVQSAIRARGDLKSVLLDNPFPTVLLGVDGYIRMSNEAASELLATPVSRLEGAALEMWVVEASRSAFREQLYKRGLGPQIVNIVRRGDARRVRIRMTSVEWSYEPCLATTLEDITEHEQKAARDEKEGRLASLGLLVAGVAHEVNNPLAFVVPNVTAVGAALKGIEPNRMVGSIVASDASEMLEEAVQGLQRIANITRDLKGFHHTDETIESLSLNEVVVDTLRLADSQLRQSSQVRRDLGALPAITANRGRLGQVVLNLLLNAAEAMPDRSKAQNQILVRTWRDGGVIRLEVSDNGKGIPRENLPNLFDPFFTTREAGTGLGLAICANIIRDMGGWIEVDSEVGIGTRFKICFPLEDHEGAPRRVLVVSEEPMLIRGTDHQFNGRYAVVQACSGFEAIRILKNQEKIDAIASARLMKNGNGRDLYDWVARHRPSLVDHFVFLDDVQEPTNGQAQLPVPVVTKPLTGAALGRLLSAVMT